jgi:outer membrane receptor protein involved in Fe transport
MRSLPGRPGAELARGRKIRSLVPALAAGVIGLAGVGAARAQYETVVIAPRQTERPREDQAASASVITSDRTPRAGETLPQLLSELPGVSVTRFGGLGAMATLSLRGSAANQVAVYIDGIPLNSATWGSVDVGSLPIADIDRIEVYRGMSPTSFGGSAIGGIVSLTSRVPAEDGVAAYAGGGSFGTGSGGGEVTWHARGVRVLAALNYLGSQGDFSYFDPNGTTLGRTDDDRVKRRENNALTQLDGLFRAVAPLPGRRELMSTLSFYWRDQGLPPPIPFDTQGAALGTRRLLASAIYSSRDDLGPGGRLRVTGYGSTSEQRLRDLYPEFSLAPTSTRDRAETFGATATGSRPVGARLRLSSTLDARRETFVPFNALSATSALPSTRSFAAGAVEGQVVVGTLELLPSVRVEAVHDEIIGETFSGPAAMARPETDLIPIARLALLQHQTDWLTLRANAGRYGRGPTMFERYGNTGPVRGNPDLVPESGVNADLGATALLGGPETTGLSVDAALFGSRVHDLIVFQPARNFERAANIGRVRILGGELALAGRLGRHGRLVAQGTFTDARDIGPDVAHHGRQLPLRPRLRLYGRPELRRLPLPGRWQLGAYGDIDVTGGNYRDPANNIPPLPRRILFGAGASLESPAGRWRLVASAQNLGNADVADLIGLPQPRRSFFLTLQWSSSANRQPEEIVP